MSAIAFELEPDHLVELAARVQARQFVDGREPADLDLLADELRAQLVGA